ncbi:MAG: Fe-S cluster assembly ATPase SufC [Acidimicrobiales bacterium]
MLKISGLHAGVDSREILRGIDLEVRSGEIHAVMGPNGSGKSTLAHVLMGRPGYEVLSGSVTLDGVELLGLAPVARAQAGLFLTFQYPIEVPGVPLASALAESLLASGRSKEAEPDALRVRLAEEAAELGILPEILARPMNVDLSGGEAKRNETLQLAVLRPRIAILDEIDSGLDVDALGQVARRIERATREEDPPLGVIAITHYRRLLEELPAQYVHVLSEGRIAASGGPELAEELERTGYAAYREDPASSEPTGPGVGAIGDPGRGRSTTRG